MSTKKYMTRKEMLEDSKLVARTSCAVGPNFCHECAQKYDQIWDERGSFWQEVHANNFLLNEIEKLVKKEAGEKLAEQIYQLRLMRKKNPHVIINIRKYLIHQDYSFAEEGYCFYDELTEEEKDFIAKRTL